MTIFLSDRSKYKKTDSYAKKMDYSTSIFGGTKSDFNRIRKDPYLKSKYVIWYRKCKK